MQCGLNKGGKRNVSPNRAKAEGGSHTTNDSSRAVGGRNYFRGKEAEDACEELDLHSAKINLEPLECTYNQPPLYILSIPLCRVRGSQCPIGISPMPDVSHFSRRMESQMKPCRAEILL